MANKSFSRGIETLGAEASMVFVGNTQHTVPYMLRHADLFDDLPPQYHDSAFLDRLHFYIPGWEVDIIRGEMFSDGYGFVVDYLAEILRNLRNHDYSHLYAEYFDLLDDLSTRDRTSIQKTFSGLMKILFPHQEASQDEIEEMLRFAIEGRKRVKDQLMRIDPTYAAVTFGYRNGSSNVQTVKTLEETEYPRHYYQALHEDVEGTQADLADRSDQSDLFTDQPMTESPTVVEEQLQKKHLTFEENQKGISYDNLFGPYLKGAQRIVVTDPYIRSFYQARNFMELMETIVKHKAEDAEVSVHLITDQEYYSRDQQQEFLERIQTASASVGVHVTWEYNNAIHARHLVTDHGWKISLDRGLDIFQRYEMNDAFDFANRLQVYRSCKAFEVTYLRIPAL
jgi:ATP-dependent Lon protease